MGITRETCFEPESKEWVQFEVGLGETKYFFHPAGGQSESDAHE